MCCQFKPSQRCDIWLQIKTLRGPRIRKNFQYYFWNHLMLQNHPPAVYLKTSSTVGALIVIFTLKPNPNFEGDISCFFVVYCHLCALTTLYAIKFTKLEGNVCENAPCNSSSATLRLFPPKSDIRFFTNSHWFCSVCCFVLSLVSSTNFSSFNTYKCSSEVDIFSKNFKEKKRNTIRLLLFLSEVNVLIGKKLLMTGAERANRR